MEFDPREIEELDEAFDELLREQLATVSLDVLRFVGSGVEIGACARLRSGFRFDTGDGSLFIEPSDEAVAARLADLAQAADSVHLPSAVAVGPVLILFVLTVGGDGSVQVLPVPCRYARIDHVNR